MAIANALTSILQQRIEQSGPISFRDFMAEALYHREFGYYASARAAIGRSGDFFTNVSVGPLFGHLLARQFAQMWGRLGGPAIFTIVEQGAHNGDFAHDVISFLRETNPACFGALRYVMVEPLESLRKRQKERLAELGEDCATWADSLAAVGPFDGIHFSNELLDAFPVHRIRWQGEGWVEQYVDWRESSFSMIGRPIYDPRLLERIALIPKPVPLHYETEVNLAMLQWVRDLGSVLRRGWALLIDYGYPRAEFYRAERTSGTLSGYRHHHRVTHLLDDPGEVDLTAHVEFTSLAEEAEACGLKTRAFLDQHHFMAGLSRLHFADGAELTRAREKELRAFKTLMHPNLMGASFKVLCLGKGEGTDNPLDLAGFSFGQDPRQLLGLAESGSSH